MLVDHGLLDLSHAVIWTKGIMGLDQATTNALRHHLPQGNIPIAEQVNIYPHGRA
jgi:hypothetical protein